MSTSNLPGPAGVHSEHEIDTLKRSLRESWASEKRLAAENEKLRKALSARLQQLEEIRQASLTWAMACPHDCPACDAMYEVIKGSSGHPTGDGLEKI